MTADRPTRNGLVDRLLGPRYAIATGDVLRHARLTISATLLLGLCALALSALLVAFDWGDMLVPGTVAAGVLFTGNAWLLRRTGRARPAALVLCLVVLAVAAATSWLQGGLLNGVLVWGLVVCISAPMLVGPRLAVLCGGLVLAHLVVLYLAGAWGHVFPPENVNRGAILSDQALATGFVWVFAWMHERSRRDALAVRDALVISLEEGSEARVALVENIDAVIFSVDRDLRLIAGNSRFERLSHAAGAPPIRVGDPVLDGLDPSQHADLRALFARALSGDHFAVERALALRVRTIDCEILFNPIRRASGEVRGVTVFGRDISERNRARNELERANRELARTAHLAGKAEVATDILHNVGNAITALDSTASLVLERLTASRTPVLGKAVALLPDSPRALTHFLVADDKGVQVRELLATLAVTLDTERDELIGEMKALGSQLEHVKHVIARQQAFARVDQVVDDVAADEVITEAVAMSADGLARDGVVVTTELAALPPMRLERYKLVEILTNLIANSRRALETSAVTDKRIVVRAWPNDRGNLQIEVADNGIGIKPEHLPRLFSYGFTTKPDGHGFGLAGSLLAARAMGGTMRGHSDGPGTGATFTVELPILTMARATQEQAA